MLKISWTRKLRNSGVLEKAGAERQLVTNRKKRKTSHLGHILPGKKYSFLQLILDGKIGGGKRGIGRKSLSWLRNICNWTGVSDIRELRQAAKMRSAPYASSSNINSRHDNRQRSRSTTT